MGIVTVPEVVDGLAPGVTDGGLVGAAVGVGQVASRGRPEPSERGQRLAAASRALPLGAVDGGGEGVEADGLHEPGGGPEVVDGRRRPGHRVVVGEPGQRVLAVSNVRHGGCGRPIVQEGAADCVPVGDSARGSRCSPLTT